VVQIWVHPKKTASIIYVFFQSANLSIFVGKVEKEVQNIRTKTTVNDVINALLRDQKDAQTPSDWVIVECWRGIERPLPPRTRLLKVWCSWKDEKQFVKFYLKRADRTSTLHRARRSRPRGKAELKGTEYFIDGPPDINLLTSGSSTGSSTGNSSNTVTSPNSDSSSSSDSEIANEHETGNDICVNLYGVKNNNNTNPIPAPIFIHKKFLALSQNKRNIFLFLL